MNLPIAIKTIRELHLRFHSAKRDEMPSDDLKRLSQAYKVCTAPHRSIDDLIPELEFEVWTFIVVGMRNAAELAEKLVQEVA
jgi:hypothetical protein